MTNVERVGELEIDQNLPFQQTMWTIQRVGWVGMSLFIIAAMLGLLGSLGPLTSAVTATPQNALQAEYDRFDRASAPTTLTLEVDAGSVQSREVRIWLAQDYLSNLRVEAVTPQPRSVEAAADRLIYTFETTQPHQPFEVVFHFTSLHLGIMSARLGLVAGPELEFHQFIYP